MSLSFTNTNPKPNPKPNNAGDQYNNSNDTTDTTKKIFTSTQLDNIIRYVLRNQINHRSTPELLAKYIDNIDI